MSKFKDENHLASLIGEEFDEDEIDEDEETPDQSQPKTVSVPVPAAVPGVVPSRRPITVTRAGRNESDGMFDMHQPKRLSFVPPEVPRVAMAKNYTFADKMNYVARELFGTYAFLTLAMLTSTQTVLSGYGPSGVVAMHALAMVAISFVTGAVCNPILLFARFCYSWHSKLRVERCGLFATIAILFGQFVVGILAGITIQFVCGVDVSVAVPDAVNMIAVQAGETPTEAGLSTAQACMLVIVASTIMVAIEMVRLPLHLEFAQSIVLGSSLAACEGATIAYLGAGCLNPAFQLGSNLVTVNIMPFRKITFVYYVFFPVASIAGGAIASYVSLDYQQAYNASVSERRIAAADTLRLPPRR